MTKKEKNFCKKPFSVWDIVIYIVFTVFVIISVIFVFTGEKGNTVKIYLDGKHLYSFELSTDRVIELEHNTVVIENGEVYISYADCPNKICLNSPPVSKAGRSISCLPNKLIVYISGDSDYDAVIGGGL